MAFIKLPDNLNGDVSGVKLFVILKIWEYDRVFTYDQMVDHIKNGLKEKNVSEEFLNSLEVEGMIQDTLKEMVDHHNLDYYESKIYFPANR